MNERTKSSGIRLSLLPVRRGLGTQLLIPLLLVLHPARLAAQGRNLGTVRIRSAAGSGQGFHLAGGYPPVRGRRSKDLTGKLAGVVGAYGNVGAVFFLTLFSVVDASTFFQCLGGYALLVLLSLLFLPSFKNLHNSYH